MTHRWTFAVLAAVLAAVGCAPEQTLPDGTFEPIKIGLVISRSGALGSGLRPISQRCVARSLTPNTAPNDS